MRGGFRFTSTPNRRFSFATVTSMCSCPWPDSSSSLVCGSRLYRIEGSSSSSRCIDVLILSSSPRLVGVGEHRLRKTDRRKGDRVRLVTDDVIGQRVLQLRHRAEIARLDFRDV